MCQHGVNHEQLTTMIAMTDELLDTSQGWLEHIAHLADHAELAQVSDIELAIEKLDEVRGILENAADAIDTHTEEGAESSVKVELV